MAYLILGLLALGLVVAVGHYASRIDPRLLARSVRYLIGGGLIGLGALLSLTGRWGVGVPMVLIGASALARGRIGNFDLGGGRRSPGQGSTVRSRFFEMQLDHDSGRLAGRVIGGRFAGRDLDQLQRGELLELAREIGGDGDSVALFEAYLDRRIPGWREDFDHDPTARTARPPDSGAMTKQQAYEILGLAAGASDVDVRAAHRRLMKRMHPDRGGSTFLAAKINQAKDILLGKHR